MGLFDRFKSSSTNNQSFTPEEAIGGVIYSVIASDGHVSDEEADYFILVANRHILLREQSAADFRKMIDKFSQILKKEGWKNLINKCANDIPHEFRPAAFALAVDFVFADGEVEAEERALIDVLQKGLGIEDDDAEVIVQTMAIKNHVR